MFVCKNYAASRDPALEVHYAKDVPEACHLSWKIFNAWKGLSLFTAISYCALRALIRSKVEALAAGTWKCRATSGTLSFFLCPSVLEFGRMGVDERDAPRLVLPRRLALLLIFLRGAVLSPPPLHIQLLAGVEFCTSLAILTTPGSDEAVAVDTTER